MKRPIAPCHNCSNRVIENGKKCEATCERMTEFKRLNANYKEQVYKAKVALREPQKPYRRTR